MKYSSGRNVHHRTDFMPNFGFFFGLEDLAN